MSVCAAACLSSSIVVRGAFFFDDLSFLLLCSWLTIIQRVGTSQWKPVLQNVTAVKPSVNNISFLLLTCFVLANIAPPFHLLSSSLDHLSLSLDCRSSEEGQRKEWCIYQQQPNPAWYALIFCQHQTGTSDCFSLIWINVQEWCVSVVISHST